MPILSAPIRPRCIEPPRLCARPNVAGRTENPGGAGLYAAMIATPSSNTTGILLAIGGSVVMSLNDLAIKALSGDYALHQVILLRALIGMALVLAVTVYSPAGMRQLITGRRGAHLLRVSIVTNEASGIWPPVSGEGMKSWLRVATSDWSSGATSMITLYWLTWV